MWILHSPRKQIPHTLYLFAFIFNLLYVLMVIFTSSLFITFLSLSWESFSLVILPSLPSCSLVSSSYDGSFSLCCRNHLLTQMIPIKLNNTTRALIVTNRIDHTGNASSSTWGSYCSFFGSYSSISLINSGEVCWASIKVLPSLLKITLVALNYFEWLRVSWLSW